MANGKSRDENLEETTLVMAAILNYDLPQPFIDFQTRGVSLKDHQIMEGILQSETTFDANLSKSGRY
jgi:hypothetical protein